MSDSMHLYTDHIPIFNDNYIWVIGFISAEGPYANSVIMVDTGDDKAAAAYLNKHHKTLAGIVITHSHWDHVDGVTNLLHQKALWTDPTHQPVYGHKTIACVNTPVDHLPCFKPWESCDVEFNIIATPGHMPEHLSYFINHAPHTHSTHSTKELHNAALFCGDTLFHAGCGRIFKGTPKELQTSLDTLQKLPDETQVYCTHEYTQSNLAFATAIEPNNEALLTTIDHVKKQRERNQITLPSSILEQKAINPFFRYRLPHIQANIAKMSSQSINSDDDAFRLLRALKDHF